MTKTQKTELEEFGATWHYDTGYLVDMLDASPDAFTAFSAGWQMSRVRKALPIEAHFAAKIATLAAERCVACLQLAVRMAVAAGVDRALLEAMLEAPQTLPQELRDVSDHARAVVAGTTPDRAAAERIEKRYGRAGFAELAVLIAGSRIFPTVKRALLRETTSGKVTVEVGSP